MKKWDEHARQDKLQSQREMQHHEEVTRAKLFELERVKRPATTAEIVRAAGHKHGEAFCLMEYVCTGKYDYSGSQRSGSGQVPRTHGCGHKEIFWNSRDGVTPFCMGCPSCGGDLQHMNWGRDIYAPAHKPHYGQGIWRDGTPDEAEAFMRYRISKYPPRTPEEAERLEATIARIRAGEEPGEFQKGWPMFGRKGLDK